MNHHVAKDGCVFIQHNGLFVCTIDKGIANYMSEWFASAQTNRQDIDKYIDTIPSRDIRGWRATEAEDNSSYYAAITT